MIPDDVVKVITYAMSIGKKYDLLESVHSQCQALTTIDQLHDPYDVSLTDRLEKLETSHQNLVHTFEEADSIYGSDEEATQKREKFDQACTEYQTALSNVREWYQLRLDTFALHRSAEVGLNAKLEGANKEFARVIVTNMIDTYTSDSNMPEEPNAEYIVKSMLPKDGDFKPLGEAIAHYGQVSQDASEEILELLNLIEPIIKDQEAPILDITLPLGIAMRNQRVSRDNPQTQMVCLKALMEHHYQRLNPKT